MSSSFHFMFAPLTLYSVFGVKQFTPFCETQSSLRQSPRHRVLCSIINSQLFLNLFIQIIMRDIKLLNYQPLPWHLGHSNGSIFLIPFAGVQSPAVNQVA